MVLVILVIIITFGMRQAWWAYSDIFFAFMMVFCQLVAVYIEKFNSHAFRTLQMCALIFGALMILALIGEFIAFQVMG